MKQIPKWFKVESAVIIFLMIAIFLVQSAITVVPKYENDVLRQFLTIHGVLLIVWIVSLIIALIKRNKNFS